MTETNRIKIGIVRPYNFTKGLKFRVCTRDKPQQDLIVLNIGLEKKFYRRCIKYLLNDIRMTTYIIQKMQTKDEKKLRKLKIGSLY